MNNNLLKKLFEDGYSFNDIKEYFELENYELLSIYENILLDYRTKDYDFFRKIKYDYLENILFTELTSEKVVIISDTHLGSKGENLEYLRQIKYFLENENISLLFHGGDIGDGLINPSRKYNSYNKQLDHICNSYLKFDGIKQYLLGGNHDMEYKKRHRDILRILSKSNKHIYPLGYYKSFFKVYEAIIAFNHMKMKGDIQLIKPAFTILGHSHRYRYSKGRIFIPPSCLENSVCYDPFIPGFLVMQATDKENLQFQMYSYTENGPEMLEEENVYIKK